MRAEERRLAYVAMTRARDELILSWAEQPGNGGRARRPSPFIAEALDRAPDAPTMTAASIPATIDAPWEEVVGPEALRATPTLSWSQLDDLLTCPLRFHLRHRVGLEGPPNHALAVGRAMHEALAAWHRALAAGEAPSTSDLHAALAAAWRSEGFLSREHEDARYVAARAALEAFVAAEGAAGDRRTVAVERPFGVEIDGIRIAGRYDRVDRTADGVVIVDYKTGSGGTERKARERARDSEQLQLYALAWQAETGALPAAMELRFLGDGLVGRAVPEPARLERSRARLAAAAGDAASGRRDPRPDPFTCGGCPFRAICPSSAG
jgi:DNA helicase-2/ATP-dependent DNA helicase PcrA